jgi:hypothetical protein
MSSAGLSNARIARLHDVMAGYVERGEVPGLVTLVSRRGETHIEALGMKALGGSDPVQRDYNNSYKRHRGQTAGNAGHRRSGCEAGGHALGFNLPAGPCRT